MLQDGTVETKFLDPRIGSSSDFGEHFKFVGFSPQRITCTIFFHLTAFSVVQTCLKCMQGRFEVYAAEQTAAAAAAAMLLRVREIGSETPDSDAGVYQETLPAL